MDERRVGFDDHTRLNRPGARGNRFGGALDLNEAHTTVAGYHESENSQFCSGESDGNVLFVITIARHHGTSLLACLDEGATSCNV